MWLAADRSPLRRELLTQRDFDLMVPTRLVGNEKMFNPTARVEYIVLWHDQDNTFISLCRFKATSAFLSTAWMTCLQMAHHLRLMYPRQCSNFRNSCTTMTSWLLLQMSRGSGGTSSLCRLQQLIPVVRLHRRHDQYRKHYYQPRTKRCRPRECFVLLRSVRKGGLISRVL